MVKAGEERWEVRRWPWGLSITLPGMDEAGGYVGFSVIESKREVAAAMFRAVADALNEMQPETEAKG